MLLPILKSGSPWWRLALLTLLGSTLLAGCTRIELTQQNPSGQRLTGAWILDFADSDPTPDFKAGLGGGGRERRGRPDQRQAQVREIRGALGSALVFIRHDFQVLSADKLVIELNHDSMGVRYHPGVYRDVSWGERQRGLWEVYAGWEDTDLVIISTADGMRVVERFVLSGDRLQVAVDITADGKERRVQRVYNRGS